MTRRSLLETGLAAAVLPPAVPVIRRVDVFPRPYAVTGHFKFLKNGERPSVLVKVTCEDGTVGWGQSVPMPTWSYETPESAVSALRDYLGPALIGKSPLDLAGAHALMDRAIAPSFSVGMPIAKAGLDLALHDITGKLAGKPLAALWSRKPLARIPLSWTVNTTSLDEAAALVEEGRRRGYRHFNIKVSPDPRFDVELAKTVRKLAPSTFLWADANGGYDPATALEVAPRLADAGVNVFEQPVAANRLTAFRDLKKQGALPIIMDEGVVSSVELVEFMRLGLLDGVAMKPARTAGLWDARRQLDILRDAGLMFLGSGITDPDVSLAASLHLFAAYGLEHPAALNGLQFLTGSSLEHPLRLEDGALAVPQGPGLGVVVDERSLRG